MEEGIGVERQMKNILKGKLNIYDLCLYLCAFLSGLVPRYIHTFKITIVIGISLFTVAVVITWLGLVRHLKISNHIECYFFYIWFVLIVGGFWRTKKYGVWASYVDWIVTAVLFMQILYHRENDRTFEVVIRAIVDALFIQLLIGLYEITAHRYLFETGDIARRLYGHVAISMFHNLNDYVTFVVTIMPFSIYLLMQKRGIVYQVYYLFIMMISVFLVIRSESRGAILGLILIVGTILFMFFRKSKLNGLIGVVSVKKPSGPSAP